MLAGKLRHKRGMKKGKLHDNKISCFGETAASLGADFFLCLCMT
jgi:hypothetical protein